MKRTLLALFCLVFLAPGLHSAELATDGATGGKSLIFVGSTAGKWGWVSFCAKTT